jgi:hypothetical protein
VQVAVYGVPADTKKCRTKVKHNTNHPIWEDEEFEFPLTVPELALVALEVRPSTLLLVLVSLQAICSQDGAQPREAGASFVHMIALA